MRHLLIALMCVVVNVACTTRKNNDDKGRGDKNKPPAKTVEENKQVVTDGKGNETKIDVVVSEAGTPPTVVVDEIKKVDPLTDRATGFIPPETEVTTAVDMISVAEIKRLSSAFGPHYAETSFLTSEGKTVVIKGFTNEALSLAQVMCLRSIAKAAGDYIKTNPKSIKQFNDKNVSIWSMVRLYDRRAKPTSSPVSPGIYFLPSAEHNSVFDGKWVVRGSFVKTSTGDECRTPNETELASGFSYYAKQILGQ